MGDALNDYNAIFDGLFDEIDIDGVDPSSQIVECKFCGTENLEWRGEEGAFYLVDENEKRHSCEKATRFKRKLVARWYRRRKRRLPEVEF